MAERKLCDSAELAEQGAGVRFTVTRRGREEPAFLVRWQGMPRAYFNRCAHVSVELDWEPGQFFDVTRLYLICTTHGAMYDPANGHCMAGPCKGARLEALEVEEREGAIYLKGSEE